MAWSWTALPGGVPFVRRRLHAVLRDKAEQGHDVDALAAEVDAAADSLDALAELAVAIADLPMRADWPYVEPTNLDEIWEESLPQRPTGSLADLSLADLQQRVRTAFLASVCGCVLGKPVEVSADLAELRAVLDPLGEWPIRDYVPEEIVERFGRPLHESWPDTVRERILFAAADDDINYTILGMLVLEEFGTAFTHGDVANVWLRHLPVTMTFGPERTILLRAAVASLEEGRLDTVAAWADILNPGEELCGALIRADAYGYAFAGRPQRAAELAWRDAMLTHRRTGVYGAMFAAAAIATAPVAEDPMDIVETAAMFVPRRSRLYEAVRFAIDEVRQAGDWLDGYEQVHRRYGDSGHCRIFQEIGTLVNSLTFATDVGHGIGLQVSQGNDTDSFGATVGSILGAYFGADRLEDRWVAPFRDDLRTGMAHFPDRSLSSVADRMAMLPELMHPAVQRTMREGGATSAAVVDTGPEHATAPRDIEPRSLKKARRLAVIAHDELKEELVAVLRPYRDRLSGMMLIATGHTGAKVADELGLEVERLRSGPLGGDVQIGARLVAGEVDALIFLRDPLTAHPHEPDIQALLKLCDTHDVVAATNRATAALVLDALTATDEP